MCMNMFGRNRERFIQRVPRSSNQSESSGSYSNQQTGVHSIEISHNVKLVDCLVSVTIQRPILAAAVATLLEGMY
jgi:hypothetical protein